MVIYSGRGRRAQEARAWRHAHACGVARRGHGRRVARLRPKGHDGLHRVAGLLPIMWSSSVGAEVMKPLATPVLGGMISSLLHVLIVTPVIFFSIRERQLGLQLQHETAPIAARPLLGRRALITTVLVIAVAGAVFAVWRLTRPTATDIGASATAGRVVQTVRSGDIDIVVRSPTSTLRTGRNAFTIEFRSSSGALVDVGTVRVSATMTMRARPCRGMCKYGDGVPGRFAATLTRHGGSWRPRRMDALPASVRQFPGKCAMRTCQSHHDRSRGVLPRFLPVAKRQRLVSGMQ